MRVLGTQHSFNDIADCARADLISLKYLHRVLEFDLRDHHQPTVTVEAGITYGELCPDLDREGYALHNMASLPHISVAGACATATHGSGDSNPNLATAVQGMQIVNGSGDVIDVSRATHRDFDGMVVALGGLGAVATITLKLERRFAIRQDVYLNLPMAQLKRHFERIMSSAYSVSLFTDWRSPRFNQVWLKHRVDAPEPVAPRHDFYEATPATTPMHPLARLSAESCTEQMGILGPWHERLPHFRMNFTPSSGAELQTEYFVSRDRAVEALDTIYAMRDDIVPLLQISEVRTIAGDNLWMSPCYEQACVGIHFTWERKSLAVMELLRKIEERLAPLHVRPHWGKLFAMQGERLASLYGERLPRFRKLLQSHDPTGKFCNAYLTGVFS